MRHSSDFDRRSYAEQLSWPSPILSESSIDIASGRESKAATSASGHEAFALKGIEDEPTTSNTSIETNAHVPHTVNYSRSVEDPTEFFASRGSRENTNHVHTKIAEDLLGNKAHIDWVGGQSAPDLLRHTSTATRIRRARASSAPAATACTLPFDFTTVTESSQAQPLDIDLETGDGEHGEPVNPKRNLTKRELLYQRLIFGSIVFSFNAVCIILSAVGYSGIWVLCAILFFKSKDFLSVWIQIFCRIYYAVKGLFITTPKGKASWILSLIPAYSESEEQIVKTLFSLRDNGMEQHCQVMCIILDGKPRPIKDHMTSVIASFEWKYVSVKWTTGTLKIDAGFVDDIPTLCIEKCPNAGKKDSLILCHDLFNYPRLNIDPSIVSLREKLWSSILPRLTNEPDFKAFDLVFCTDADSTIHQGALAKLANACLADPRSIAACGFVFVEYEPGLEWSVWNLYQQFQYSFGQIVRRGAEHFIGKVTCLPGCITMIVVRPEMAGAIQKYAKPVTAFPVLRHQVQYLGTDRRLTYSMLSQGKHLHTLFVPEAGSETVAPQSLQHYLSQRRRWGSNAYFNNYFYFAGDNMILITRIAALVEITRLTMVYYRVFNTGLFLYGVATNFSIVALAPLLAISFLPSVWFAFAVCFLNAHLRRNWKKLFCGFCINRCVSPFMSVAVFSLVAKNLGSQVWGMSGVTAAGPATPAQAVPGAADASPPPLKQRETAAEEKDRLALEGGQERPDLDI